MEPKRELSSVDLAALVQELRGLTGAKLDKAYLYGEDLLRLRMRDFDQGRVELMIEVGEIKRIHTVPPEEVRDAPDRPPDFARKLRDRIAGGEFDGIEQYEFDRILTIDFDRPDGQTRIVVELFGEGNVVIVDANGKVIDCLETVRLKSRTVVPGAQYEFPASRVNPLALRYEAFVEQMEASDADIVRTLATQLNLGGFYAEEICTRANVDKTRPIEDADTAEFEALFGVLEGLREDLWAGEFDSRVYWLDGDPIDVAPFPLEERAGLESETFESFNAALAAYFAALERQAQAGDDTGPAFEEQIAKRERIIVQQEEAIERFEEEAAEVREKAELVYANYGLVDEVLSTIQSARNDNVPWDEIAARLEDGADQGIEAAQAVLEVNPENGTVELALDGAVVELDPMEGVERNADRLYTEAKDIEGKRDGALEALEESREELSSLKDRRDTMASDPDPDTDSRQEGTGEAVNWVGAESIPVRQSDQWYERFRWVETSDGFLVLGGRNADQNEELVKKYLEPHDRFFHAQASGAPVTILKASGPSEPSEPVEFPEATLEESAQFAVSYSSVWKDGRFAGDVYMVGPDQVSKTPESGEYLGKGSFVIRGDRTYFRDTPVGCAVGIMCEPETRVIGGPPRPIQNWAAVAVEVEPGGVAQGDVAKRIYRRFREVFVDTSFVRKVASPDEIAMFLPPGQSRIKDTFK